MAWFLYAALLVAGFALGRARWDRVVDWAEDWTTPGWKHWRFWPAAPVAVAALALVWIVHPRRTLANVRSWRAGERLHPVPQRAPAMTFRHIPDHTGGNAEDCPACHGTNPPYPFICPGPDGSPS